MKRFTATEKWDDPWFWELSATAKLLFLFLCDHCDSAGIVELSLKFASMKIGSTVEEKHLAELQSRLHKLPTGKWLIIGFIRFQYGTLSRDCKPHNPVFASLSKHGTDLTLVESLCKPYPKGFQTLQEKEKEKDKEKDPLEGVQGEIPLTPPNPPPAGNGNGWHPTPVQLRLGSLFGRKPVTKWSDKEQKSFKAIGEIPEPDLALLESYYKAKHPPDRDYRRRDLYTLLNNFSGEVDRARKFRAAAPTVVIPKGNL